ncbi:CLUMA_CG009243, isoform A [Clunio marinus]|uniref:CLUMA_CG009243, isoform A n=1 Tax=Clunio marinus TaxID=568069 RepID=A0A1J1I7S2_9DIPT|nr:CLUMA_CG009243, isoform A [Clunio marinus]
MTRHDVIICYVHRTIPTLVTSLFNFLFVCCMKRSRNRQIDLNHRTTEKQKRKKNLNAFNELNESARGLPYTQKQPKLLPFGTSDEYEIVIA